MMRTVLTLLAGALLSGCAVYNTAPYPYPAAYPYPAPVIYQDPWPVRVPVYPPVIVDPLYPR